METGDILPTDEARFSAFVSYSHVDSATAKKLHRKIETYKLPKRLRHLQTDGAKGGASDGRVGQIFRDRDDLPAALDLSESVKEALTQSRALIVVCSPAAKASPWVNKEITLFRELHPDRPILAALVAGEPDEAFPEALLEGGEPLAADLRKESDGWRLGLLKLIAGIAELPLDSLVQRDAQRHLRRVMTVTGGTVVALLAMIGMTIFALQSRNEAQQQQAQAEGLVEYMLTDLRDELKGVGRLDVMTDVNERAMDYYGGQGDLSDRPAASLERRARILHAMGEDDEKRGDLDKALAKFTEAHRVTEALLAQDPENADRIFGHAQSEYWLGLIAYWKRDWSQTEKYWLRYKLLSNLLLLDDPSNSKWLKEAGYADGNLCTLTIERTDIVNDAVPRCRSSLNYFKNSNTINQDSFSNLASIANRHAWLAEAFEKNLDRNNEYAERKKAEQLIGRLTAKEPKNADFAELWLVNQISLVDVELASKREVLAARRINALQLKITHLINLDPSNATWESHNKTIKSLKGSRTK